MVRAVFADCEKTVMTEGMFQWDYGQQLVITGLLLNQAEVHFTDKECKEKAIQMATIDQDGTVSVQIPDRLLELGEELHAYVYALDEKAGKTVRTIIIPVRQRPKPEECLGQKEQSILQEVLKKIDIKADGIEYDGEYLQLLAENKPIGNRIRIDGSGGREIELRNSGSEIQWRYTDSNKWTSLIQVEDLRGEAPKFEIRAGHLFAIYNK